MGLVPLRNGTLAMRAVVGNTGLGVLILILLIIALVACGRVSPQTSDPMCCRLEVSLRPNSTELVVAVTNVEIAKVNVLRTSTENDVRIQLRGADGREPERTEQGKRILTTRPRGSVHFRPLAKEQTLTETLELRELYILRTGSYALTVFREVYIGEKKVELQTKTTIQVLA